jgi:arylsulfatase A-like enzyme
MPPPAAFVPFHPFDNGAIKIRDEMTLPWPRTKADLARKFARYCASTEYWDAEMGRVIEALRVARQFENTVFIIAGDNGLSLGEHGLLGKQNLYEFGGMHVPLVFSGKGVKRGESKAFAYLMDAFPTICELTGTPIPTRVEGLSLSPVMAGRKKTVRDFCFTAYGKSQRAVCDGRWKLIRYPLIDKTQLFDLNRDAHEERDLARRPELAARIKQLMAKLAELQRQFADPYPLTMTNLQPAVWSPAQLTSEDLAAQEKETAITFQLPPYLKAPRRDETGSPP